MQAVDAFLIALTGIALGGIVRGVWRHRALLAKIWRYKRGTDASR